MCAFAAAFAVGCDKNDDNELMSQSEFKMSEIRDLVDDELLPDSNDWTIIDPELSVALGDDDQIAELLEMAADAGRTINLTLANVTKVRSEFLMNVRSGLGVLSIPKATDIRYRALFGTRFTTLYLTAEDDFSSKLNEAEDGYVAETWRDGISESAFEYANIEEATLVLNKNKEGLTIPGLTDRDPNWGEILYQ